MSLSRQVQFSPLGQPKTGSKLARNLLFVHSKLNYGIQL